MQATAHPHGGCTPPRRALTSARRQIRGGARRGAAEAERRRRASVVADVQDEQKVHVRRLWCLDLAETERERQQASKPASQQAASQPSQPSK